MPFVSSAPVARLALAVNRLANLPRRPPGARPLPPWDPTLCNPFEQQHISNAFFSLANSQIPVIEGHGGDWKKLADLMKTKTVNSLNITCAWCRGGSPMSSDADSQSLQVCLDTSSSSFLRNWLLVEVVHLCGGTDLDAWAIKNWLFSVDKSSFPYAYYQVPSSELQLMCAGGTKVGSNYRAGRFTLWDPVGGNLWPSNRAAATANNPVPAHGYSLIAGGGPRGYWQWPCL